MIKPYGVIYKITNAINGKVYIGQTIKTAHERFQEHIYSARRGSKYALHSAIRKHGESNFAVEEIIACGSQVELNQQEIHQISTHSSVVDSGLGYNMTFGGEQGRLSQEGERIRLAALLSPEIQEKIKQRLNSPEVKRRISESHKGYVPTAQARARMSASRKGRKTWNCNPTEAIRERLRQAHKGCRPSERTFQRAQEANRIHPPSRFAGHLHTDESKEKTRAAMKIAASKREQLQCPYCDIMSTKAGLVVHIKFRHAL